MKEIAALDQNTVYQAVQKNKPLFERVITVTGKSVAKPSNFLARIGTPMKQLIDACGGLPEDTGKIIGGGPMMGKALVNTEVPTAKGSSGILIMNQKEAKRGEVQPCIRCAKCVGACPMGLGTLFAVGTCRTYRIRFLINEKLRFGAKKSINHESNEIFA